MKTTKWFATVGINPSYFHKNELESGNYLKTVGAIWQHEAKMVHLTTGIYVGAVITPSITVYHEDWGCPSGGEQTVSITGEYNPHFSNDSVKYKEAVLTVLQRVAILLEQTTTQITFQKVDFEYLKLNEV